MQYISKRLRVVHLDTHQIQQLSLGLYIDIQSACNSVITEAHEALTLK